MKTIKLISELKEITLQNIELAQKLYELSDESLNWRNDPKSWSILECLEHLNIYGNFYLPEIENTMSNATIQSDDEFKPGFLGNYFAKSMQPKVKLNKMKTFKKTDPIGSMLTRNVIDTFINQQNKLLELVDRSEKVNLNKLKTGISITKWIRIKLGDTFRFVIYHNQRHILQAERVLSFQIKTKEKSEV